jgi:two-component system chemotaxis response regulator CheB
VTGHADDRARAARSAWAAGVEHADHADHLARVKAALAGRALRAVVIGASAGGIDALLTILPGLPAQFGFGVVVVLHLPDDRGSRLAEVFGQRLGMPVREAVDKAPVLPGVVYFAAAGYHLSIETDHHFSLSREEPVHYSRPAIDILMTSAADAYGAGLAAILLTGASADGAAGLAQAQAQGALAVVQDPDEAEIGTMPRAALARCTPELVLPLAGIRTLLHNLETH